MAVVDSYCGVSVQHYGAVKLSGAAHSGTDYRPSSAFQRKLLAGCFTQWPPFSPGSKHKIGGTFCFDFSFVDMLHFAVQVRSKGIVGIVGQGIVGSYEAHDLSVQRTSLSAVIVSLTFPAVVYHRQNKVNVCIFELLFIAPSSP